MTNQELLKMVEEWSEEFGAKSLDKGQNCILRKNLIDLSFQNGEAYFGYVRPEEEPTGAYSDFLYVVCQSKEDEACVVALLT